MKEARRLRQRIDQSIVFRFMRKNICILTRVLTKMRVPSASFCQRSTILVSSSSAALEYMERGPELSPKLDSPYDGVDCQGQGGHVLSVEVKMVWVGSIGDILFVFPPSTSSG
jgi:hypothetical protein